MKQIEQITTWNKIADNNTFNYHLENSMLIEELSELVIAMKTKNYTEMLDAVADIFIIGVGTLHKVWFTAEQIETALDRIILNNYSKFQYDEKGSHICVKDSNGKIMKPEWFTPVDLSDIIPQNLKN